MMTSKELDTEQLLLRIEQGDEQARDQLLDRHRHRLTKLIAMRMDDQLNARIDPSDVVQESLMMAHNRFNEYTQKRDVPFYVWLRALALERLVDLYRQHVRSQKRSVRREEMVTMSISDASLANLARNLVCKRSSPSAQARKQELHAKLKLALNALKEHDREVLVLRHLEQLKVREIASILGITEGAVKVRHVRALERLRQELGDLAEEML